MRAWGTAILYAQNACQNCRWEPFSYFSANYLKQWIYLLQGNKYISRISIRSGLLELNLSSTSSLPLTCFPNRANGPQFQLPSLGANPLFALEIFSPQSGSCDFTLKSNSHQLLSYNHRSVFSFLSSFFLSLSLYTSASLSFSL